MELSLVLILDELGLEAEVHLPEGLNPKFSSAELYVAGDLPLAADKLLVCPLSEAIAAEKRDGLHFLCVRDRMVDERESERAMAGITVVRRNMGMRELFNLVQRVFVKVREWVMAMERSTATRSGLQELLDLSEPIFRNFITIQDGTFKLIAHTNNIEPPSVIMSRLVQYGYHPQETMELLQRNRRLEEYKTADIIVSRDRATSDYYDVVKKIYHVDGAMFLLVVMECCGKEANRATIELFGIFIQYIKVYVDSEIAQRGGIGGVKLLALDILNNSVESKEEAMIRSAHCGYPFTGSFLLYIFSFTDERNVPIERIVKSLEEISREGVAFAREKNVLLIGPERMDIHTFHESAASTLNVAGFTCGISNSFGCLWDLPIAYEQALIAVDVSGRLKTPAQKDARKRFCRFAENLSYHIVSAGYRAAPSAFENSFPARSIALLREYDYQHHTETMKILRLFLENERNATAVSAIMHMHRNTVLYHMERVSDLLGVSLDDPETRFQLLLAFKADDFQKL